MDTIDSIDSKREPYQRFLTSKEIAVYLGLSEPTIRSWVQKGRIPFAKLGRAVRFDVRRIETWVKGKTYKAQESHLDEKNSFL